MLANKMKPIAIHDNKVGFTKRWIEYCTINSIPFIKVNCYDSNIIEVLKNCSALMWHWNYENYKDYLFARQLLITSKVLKIIIFPNFWTTFLCDDKLGQKYLFESLDVRIPKTYVFYDKKEAINWAREIHYPIVFKLRCGAGSQNVQFVDSLSMANKLIKKSFSSGFSKINKQHILKDRFIIYFRNKNLSSIRNLFKSIYRFFIPKFDENFIGRESGYVLFQEFLPNNSFDTRLIVLGKRCFGIRRYNRKNDFRASGSGLLDYDPAKIDKRAIKIAFNIADKLKSSSLALDFLFDSNSNPVVTEMSYGFPVGDFTDNCTGYWDSVLNWHECRQNLQYLMVEDLLSSIISNSE